MENNIMQAKTAAISKESSDCIIQTVKDLIDVQKEKLSQCYSLDVEKITAFMTEEIFRHESFLWTHLNDVVRHYDAMILVTKEITNNIIHFFEEKHKPLDDKTMSRLVLYRFIISILYGLTFFKDDIYRRKSIPEEQFRHYIRKIVEYELGNFLYYADKKIVNPLMDDFEENI